MDEVADTNVDATSGAMIIRTGIEIIMEMAFKRGAMLGCAISAVKSVDLILTTIMDFMMLGSVILALFPCHLTMNIGSCQGRLLVLKLELDPLREPYRAFQTNTVWIFLKLSLIISERRPLQDFLPSSLTSPRCWIIYNG